MAATASWPCSKGGAEGLTLTSSETNADLPSPTALAYSALTGGQIQFYAATAGREVATLVDLSLGGETQPPPPTNNLAQLVPLQQSSLAVVGTLLVTMIESPGAEVNLSPAETETTTALAFSLATPVGQGTPGQGGNDNAGGGGDEEAGTPADAAANRAGPDASSWQTFVLGTDEALEQFQRERQGLSPESGDLNAGSAPPEVEHESGSPGSVGPSDVKSSLFRLPGDPGQESSRATLRSRQAEAIDAVISSLWDQDADPAGGQWRSEPRCLRTIPRGLASVHSRHPGLSPARDPTARNSLSLRRSGMGRQPERTPRAPHPDPAPGLPRSDQESANRGFGLDGSRYNGGWLGLCRPCRPESRSPQAMGYGALIARCPNQSSSPSPESDRGPRRYQPNPMTIRRPR